MQYQQAVQQITNLMTPANLTLLFTVIAGVLAVAKAVFEVRKARTDKATAQAQLDRAGAELERQKAELANVREGQRLAVESIPADYEMDEWVNVLRMGDDGSGLVTRHCRRIRARAGLSEVRIPYRLEISAGAMGQWILAPNPSPQPGMGMHVINAIDPQVFEGDVVIPAHLFGPQREVGFTIEQPVTKAFCTSKEQADSLFRGHRFKDEYYGNTLTVPVHKMTIEVEFPPAFGDAAARSFPTVFYGDSEIPNGEEIDRLRSMPESFDVTGRTAKLTVTKPTRGHHYAVAWAPPPSAAVVSSEPAVTTSFSPSGGSSFSPLVG